MDMSMPILDGPAADPPARRARARAQGDRAQRPLRQALACGRPRLGRGRLRHQGGRVRRPRPDDPRDLRAGLAARVPAGAPAGGDVDDADPDGQRLRVDVLHLEVHRGACTATDRVAIDEPAAEDRVVLFAVRISPRWVSSLKKRNSPRRRACVTPRFRGSSRPPSSPSGVPSTSSAPASSGRSSASANPSNRSPSFVLYTEGTALLGRWPHIRRGRHVLPTAHPGIVGVVCVGPSRGGWLRPGCLSPADADAHRWASTAPSPAAP